MIRRSDITVSDALGTPEPGVYVTVKNSLGALATIYDDSGNLMGNPLQSGLGGVFTYNILETSAGTYTEEFRLSLSDLPRRVATVDLSVAGAASARVAVGAEWFGAVGDGVTNDAAAIIAALASVGDGGEVVLQRGKTYAIGSTITLSKNGAKLTGAGAGDVHDTGTAIVAPTRLKWIGASAGTMVKVQSGTPQFIAGNEFRGIFLDGNSGLAAVGLNLIGSRLGTYEVVGAHLTSALLKMDPDTALSEPQGCTENHIVRLSGYQTNVGDGSLLLETSTSSWNCSHNTFDLISGDYTSSNAIIINGSDSETYSTVKLYCTTGAGPAAIVLGAGATALQAARNNVFVFLTATNCTVPVFAKGTTYGAFPSIENNIIFLDTANNPNLPSLDTGAKLSWGTARAPLGYRSFSTSANSIAAQKANGNRVQSGVSGTINPGNSSVITFPTALSTSPVIVTVVPKTTPTVFSAGASATAITIVNSGSGVATDFYWHVEGY